VIAVLPLNEPHNEEIAETYCDGQSDKDYRRLQGDLILMFGIGA
jgi:hypothetical protein